MLTLSRSTDGQRAVKLSCQVEVEWSLFRCPEMAACNSVLDRVSSAE